MTGPGHLQGRECRAEDERAHSVDQHVMEKPATHHKGAHRGECLSEGTHQQVDIPEGAALLRYAQSPFASYTYRVRLAQNDMTFMEGPEDGCAVIINKSHPFAERPMLTLKDLAELRLAFNPQRDQYFVYRDICPHFAPSGIIHIPEQENLLRLISMDVSTAAVLPRSVLLAPGGWAQKVCAKDVEDFPMPGRIWLIYPRDMRSSEKLVQESIADLLEQLKKEELPL